MELLFSPAASISDVEHFKSIPWCARHLAAPNLIVGRPLNRRLGSGQAPADGLFGATLNTPDTIPSIVLFYPDPDATPAEPQPSIPEVKTLVTLGPLVSGFGGVCHGGIVMTLLDEALSLLVQVNWKRGAIKGNTQLMTAYLNTMFSKPVTVPGTFLVTARLDKVEGRKAFGSVWIEDEHGVTLTKAEGLFVMVREKL